MVWHGVYDPVCLNEAVCALSIRRVSCGVQSLPRLPSQGRRKWPPPSRSSKSSRPRRRSQTSKRNLREAWEKSTPRLVRRDVLAVLYSVLCTRYTLQQQQRVEGGALCVKCFFFPWGRRGGTGRLLLVVFVFALSVFPGNAQKHNTHRYIYFQNKQTEK